MVDVLLISPPFKGMLREPLGLYYLASVLESNGISVSIFDFNIDLPKKSHFKEYICNLNPKIVGVTSYTFNVSAASDILKEIKQINPKILTVMGGVHVSALPERVLESIPSLNFIVMGEGEITFLELCQKILDGESVRNIRGLALKEDKIIINPSRDFLKDLDTIPIVNRGLVSIEKYPIASVQTSRGCPYNCIFCCINALYNRRIRFRDPKKVVEECDILINRYKKEHIYFFGDAFTFNNSWVEEMCDEIIRKRIKFKWGCETRVDNVTPPLLKKMRKAGCVEVHFGVDYGDEEVLKNLGKDISLGEVYDAVRWAKEAELFAGAFFIFNCPGEDEETMENTFNLIQETPVDAIEINLLTPYPGTILWGDLESFGMRIFNHDFDYYTTKKYVMENIHFPRKRFVPTFKRLLKRLNLIPLPGHTPEIYNFLKRDIRLRAWA